MATKSVCGAHAFAGSKQEKVLWPNDNGLPCGEVISDTLEYESSGTFRVGAKS